MKFIIIIFIILLQISCNNESEKNNLKKISIPESEFKIPIIFALKPLHIEMDYSANYKAKISRSYWSSYCNFSFTYDSLDHYFENTSLEIEFQRYLFRKEIDFYIPGYCLIGSIKKEFKDLGFVIFWINRIQNKEETLTKVPLELEISNKIDKTTDTIFSTLSKDLIYKLYPEFKGIYKNIKLDSIVIDNTINVSNLNFYNKIRFYDFKFGIGVWAN